MAKQVKQYLIHQTRGIYTVRRSVSPPLTVAEAVEYFRYTLDVGACYAHERGNKKINCAPTSIKGLITNLNNASSNSGAHNSYSAEEYNEVAQ